MGRGSDRRKYEPRVILFTVRFYPIEISIWVYLFSVIFLISFLLLVPIRVEYPVTCIALTWAWGCSLPASSFVFFFFDFTPQATPRHILSQIRAIGKSSPSTWLICSHTWHVICTGSYSNLLSQESVISYSASYVTQIQHLQWQKHSYSTLKVELLATDMITWQKQFSCRMPSSHISSWTYFSSIFRIV